MAKKTIKALLEIGERDIVVLKGLEHPYIAKDRAFLYKELSDDIPKEQKNQLKKRLNLVGKIENDGKLIAHSPNFSKIPRRLNKEFIELNTRIMILEDGRVFIDPEYVPPDMGNYIFVQNFTNSLFLGYNFSNRFDSLYRQSL